MKFAISSIKITNFRQYKGMQTLDFKNDKQKNVAIILGKNGSGKSNLLNAITWCLYGKEIHKKNDIYDSESMPVINTTVLSLLKNNENTFAEVIVQLDTSIGSWSIKRHIDGGKDALGEKTINEHSTLTVVHPVGKQDKIESGEDTQILINNLLPDALKSFFFIDGEQLREFFKISTPDKIAEAIDIVSQLELVYKSEEHLEKYENALRKNIKSTTPLLQTVQKNIELTQQSMKKIKESIIEFESSQKKDYKELLTVKEFLKNHSSTVVSKLEEERQLIESDVKNLKEIINKKETQRNGYLVEIAPFIYLKKDIDQTYKIIEDKVEKGELPPQIKETFIRELIENGRCICGNKLTDESQKILEEYRKKASLSELSEISIVGKTTIAEIQSSIQEFPEKINEMNGEIADLIGQLETKERRLEHISDEIKEFNLTEIRRYEDRREELDKLIAKNDQLLLMKKAELEACEDTLKHLKGDEERELSKDKKNVILKNKLTLVHSALDVLNKTENIIKTKIRKQVEQSTNENFKTLIRKKEAFKSISINENYEVRVQHKDGYNVINDLSAGEYLILGLSFMSALMTISGFQAPVIIDTPLGKIDDEHREYITTELPKFLSGTQLVFLVTPTEYDENVKRNLKQFLLKENFYQITENIDKTESMVGRSNVS